ncbi:hypothetical protein ACFC0N_32530 [Streptomyces zaomyceticus]
MTATGPGGGPGSGGRAPDPGEWGGEHTLDQLCAPDAGEQGSDGAP